jgi:GT2 family glycosyltransferase
MANPMADLVAAVLVTYNRKELLLECLGGLTHQSRPFDKIILIDNASSDGTTELLGEKGYLANPLIDYVRLSENTGGAGGFHAGVKRGCGAGYDWLLLMDDDTCLENECLENLLGSANRLKRENPAALICARVRTNQIDYEKECKKKNLSNPFKQFHQTMTDNGDFDGGPFEIDLGTFEGFFIKSSIVKQIGYPNKDMFIYGDDTDYSIRAALLGKIFCVPSARLKKLRDSNFEKKWDWKKYLIVRNMFYLDLRYGTMSIRCIRVPYKFAKLLISKIVSFEWNTLAHIFKLLFEAKKMSKVAFDQFNQSKRIV